MALTAFALAGLGGFNAHGAGFLAAAAAGNVVPDLVTVTSGQILVLADWLQHKDLEQSVVDGGSSGRLGDRMQFHLLRRREFWTLVGGAAAWPIAAQGQESGGPVVALIFSGGHSTSDFRNFAALGGGLRESG